MSLSRNHELVTQDYPWSLLWAVSCGNYILCTKLHPPPKHITAQKEAWITAEQLTSQLNRGEHHYCLHHALSWAEPLLIITQVAHLPFLSHLLSSCLRPCVSRPFLSQVSIKFRKKDTSVPPPLLVPLTWRCVWGIETFPQYGGTMKESRRWVSTK